MRLADGMLRVDCRVNEQLPRDWCLEMRQVNRRYSAYSWRIFRTAARASQDCPRIPLRMSATDRQGSCVLGRGVVEGLA